MAGPCEYDDKSSSSINEKVKLSRYLIKYHAMKTYGRVEV
jgi:hypothetical protein